MGRLENFRSSAIIFIIGVVIRAPLILIPPSGGLYNVDELAMSLSVLDRWLGLPATNLCWPAVPLQLAAFLVFAPEFVVAILADHSLDQLAHVIFAHYQDPSSIILVLRVVSTLAGAATAVALYQLVRNITESSIAGVTAAVISTLIPLSLQLSVMATADAVALMFCAWTARWLLVYPVRPYLVGFASAAAVSTKAAMGVWLLPIVLGGLLFIYKNQDSRKFWNTIGRCVGAGITGIVLFDPYLWIDPLRSAKSIVGNVLSHAGNVFPSMEMFSIAIPGQSVLFAVVILSLVAAVSGLSSERWKYAGVAVALTTTAILLLFLRIGFDYWRYMTGLIVPGLVLFALLFIRRERALALIVLPVAVFGLGSIVLTSELRIREGIGLGQLFKMVQEKCERGETIWLQDVTLSFQYDRLRLPQSTILQIVSYLENSDRSSVLTNWMEGAGMGAPAAIALQTAFDEDEQVSLARWRGLAAIASEPECHMQLFRSDSNKPDGRSGYLRGSLTENTLDDVLNDLRRSTNKVAINVVGETKVLNAIALPVTLTTRGDAWAIGAKPAAIDPN
jgi:hypothetical protein